MDIDYLYEVLELSRITLIGYSCVNEQIKDKIISKIPYLEYNINSNLYQTIRELKLNSLINGVKYKSPKYILIDYDKCYDSSFDSGKYEGYRSYFERELNLLRLNINFRIIVLSNNFKYVNSASLGVTCGDRVIRISDVMLSIKEEYIVISKNRYGGGNGNIIEFDGLEEYNYICNYENIK